MNLHDTAIHAFQEAYRKDFGEEVSEEQAQLLGSQLLQLMSIVYRPIPNDSTHE